MQGVNSSSSCTNQKLEQPQLQQRSQFSNYFQGSIISTNTIDYNVPLILELQDTLLFLQNSSQARKEINLKIKENKLNHLESISQNPTQILEKKRKKRGKKDHKIREDHKLIQTQQNEKYVGDLLPVQKLSFPIINYFVIFGAIRLESGEDFQEDINECTGRSHQFKVLQIEKKHSRYFIQLINGYFERENKNEQFNKYEMLTKKLESSNDKMKYEKAQMIKQLAFFYDQYNKHLELVRIFYAHEEQKLRNLQNLRIEYMKNEVMKFKKQYGFDENDFVVSFYFSPDFAKRVQALHSLEVNLPFISLIGVTGDEFVSIVMRYGVSWWFGDGQGDNFNKPILRGLLSQQNYYEEAIYDQELKTIDGFSLKCTTQFIVIKNIFCEDIHSYLPMQLSPPLDLICIMRYEIEVHDIKKLLDMRQMKDNIRDTLDPLINTFTYTVNSEAFVEKFYGVEEKPILNNEENDDSQIQEEEVQDKVKNQENES